nr:helix-turn-helix domain-containing protein [Gemmatimonadaceae bacterium]
DMSTCAVIGAEIARHLSPQITYTDTTSQSRWLNAQAAAQHLGISVDAVYKRARLGVIPSHQDGPGARLFFDADELDAALRRGRT